MTKMTIWNKFQNLSKLVHPGWLLPHISLYLQKNSIFGIKSASLRKISLFAVNDLLFYLFELHIFPKWFSLLLLCTSAPLVLCCDRFDRGSRQVKHEPVDLVTEDYNVSLCQRIGLPKLMRMLSNYSDNEIKAASYRHTSRGQNIRPVQVAYDTPSTHTHTPTHTPTPPHPTHTHPHTPHTQTAHSHTPPTPPPPPPPPTHTPVQLQPQESKAK